jgi:hypothetical protein
MSENAVVTDTRRPLLIKIAGCGNVERCLTSRDRSHPCSEVVLEQWPTNSFEERVGLWPERHQLPEPWLGHLESAPILFVSSNPSLSMPSEGYTRANANDRHVTASWSDEQIDASYTTAFETAIKDGVRMLKRDGTVGPVVRYWQAVCEQAEMILGREPIPGQDYALTEAVHCKSASERGVGSALDTCADLYLRDVLALSPARLVVIVGRPSRMAFRRLFAYADDVLLSEPMEIAGLERRVAFIAGPRAVRSKVPRQLPDEVLEAARDWVASAQRSKRGRAANATRNPAPSSGTRLFFNRQEARNIQQLIGRYPGAELSSPTCSTVPLLSFIKTGGEFWQNILSSFATNDDEVEVHAEFTVAPVAGRGKASHTDLMLIRPGHALAIEAKWTEPPYETVGEWLLGGDSENSPANRQRVMNGWLSLVQPSTKKLLSVRDFGDARYQMVHRAASACLSGSSPAVAYLQFSLEADGTTPHAQQLSHDLAHLHQLFGSPAKLPFVLYEVKMSATRAYQRIAHLPKGRAETAVKVRAALLAKEPLFEFVRCSQRRVSKRPRK